MALKGDNVRAFGPHCILSFPFSSLVAFLEYWEMEKSVERKVLGHCT